MFEKCHAMCLVQSWKSWVSMDLQVLQYRLRGCGGDGPVYSFGGGDGDDGEGGGVGGP